MKRTMMIFALLAIGLLVPLSASACTYGQISIELNTEFTLKAGETAVVNGEQLRIKFVEVTSDSRCPNGVECVQAGEADCLMLIYFMESESSVTFTQKGMENDSRVNFEEYIITFFLEPYPVSGEEIKPADYRLIMTVIK